MCQPLGHCLLLVDISCCFRQTLLAVWDIYSLLLQTNTVGCLRQILLAVSDTYSWVLQWAVSKCEVLVIISGRGTGHDKPGIKITPYQRSDNICTQDWCHRLKLLADSFTFDTSGMSGDVRTCKEISGDIRRIYEMSWDVRILGNMSDNVR